ncbi:hypothetical protein RHRU231_230020 [Rhodococcus ruber]|uniref:Uncharacterized protein n=1 Tax=Rhodococcus ruber TaxID=1830 RepID=A0A098BG72_9NOCA|nr:hypothetical protein RHRU231_230020 [Rhodococcus ruber]
MGLSVLVKQQQMAFAWDYQKPCSLDALGEQVTVGRRHKWIVITGNDQGGDFNLTQPGQTRPRGQCADLAVVGEQLRPLREPMRTLLRAKRSTGARLAAREVTNCALVEATRKITKRIVGESDAFRFS